MEGLNVIHISFIIVSLIACDCKSEIEVLYARSR